MWSVTTAASEKSCCRWIGERKEERSSFHSRLKAFFLTFAQYLCAVIYRRVNPEIFRASMWLGAPSTTPGFTIGRSSTAVDDIWQLLSCQMTHCLNQKEDGYIILFGSIHKLCLCLNSAQGKEKSESVRWVGREWMPVKQRPSGGSRCCPRTHAAFPSVTSHPQRGGFLHMFL